MEFTRLISERFSCRSISDKAIEAEKLEAILTAAQLAPTALNRQAFRIFSLTSDSARECIRQSTHCTYGADHFLLLGAHKGESWVRSFDNKDFSDVDAAIVGTHMMLAIHNEGLASTWVGHFDTNLLYETFPVLADYELVALFPFGYPTEEGVPSERHTIRKELSELVVEL